MNTILIWNAGDSLCNCYKIPTELLRPYIKARGKMINGDANIQQTNLLEHLGWMLGEEIRYEPIPSLEDWLKIAPDKLLETPTLDQLSLEVEDNKDKDIIQAPWEQYKIDDYRIDCYINDIFPCGWYV